MKPVLLIGPVLIAAACSATDSDADAALVMDPSVPAEVRQAATCLAFNAEAERYLSGVQLEMHDYDEATIFWSTRLLAVEPSHQRRSVILDSALLRQSQDFEPAPQDTPDNVQRFEMSYASIIGACQAAREAMSEGGSKGSSS